MFDGCNAKKKSCKQTVSKWFDKVMEMEKMTDKEIQASDEEMEQFNILQNEKCVSVKTEKLNDLKNRISFMVYCVVEM